MEADGEEDDKSRISKGRDELLPVTMGHLSMPESSPGDEQVGAHQWSCAPLWDDLQENDFRGQQDSFFWKCDP